MMNNKQNRNRLYFSYDKFLRELGFTCSYCPHIDRYRYNDLYLSVYLGQYCPDEPECTDDRVYVIRCCDDIIATCRDTDGKDSFKEFFSIFREWMLVEREWVRYKRILPTVGAV